MKKNVFITLLLLSITCFSQKKVNQRKVYVDKQEELKPFIGAWRAEKGNLIVLINLFALAEETGRESILGKFKIEGEYTVINKQKIEDVYESKYSPKPLPEMSSMSAFELFKSFKTKYLDLNKDMLNSYFIGFSEKEKCMTRIISKITILPSSIDTMLWKSEIKVLTKWDNEGIYIPGESDEGGCKEITNINEMTIPSELIFKRVK